MSVQSLSKSVQTAIFVGAFRKNMLNYVHQPSSILITPMALADHYLNRDGSVTVPREDYDIFRDAVNEVKVRREHAQRLIDRHHALLVETQYLRTKLAIVQAFPQTAQ